MIDAGCLAMKHSKPLKPALFATLLERALERADLHGRIDLDTEVETIALASGVSRPVVAKELLSEMASALRRSPRAVSILTDL